MNRETYLINSTRREYVLIGTDYPKYMPHYLQDLEQKSSWDLGHDDIYLDTITKFYGYTDVRKFISNLSKGGGEIIEEHMLKYFHS
jgi:hypothetical protein